MWIVKYKLLVDTKYITIKVWKIYNGKIEVASYVIESCWKLPIGANFFCLKIFEVMESI